MIIIAAGSSLPVCGVDSQQIVLSAFLAIDRVLPLRDKSSLYRSPAWPDPSDPPFVNACAIANSDADPFEVLRILQAVENAFGRKRERRNGPRTLDLDLIACRDIVIETAELTLPHPRCKSRAFVLAPLAEIAPEWTPPGGDSAVQSMLSSLGEHDVVRITAPRR